jgi:hypothetical protein
MSKSSIIQSKEFWNCLKRLLELDHPQEIEALAKSLEIPSRTLTSYLTLLNDLNYSFDLSTDSDGQKFISPPSEKPKFNISLDLYDWLEFQAHFPHLEKAQGEPFHEHFKSLLANYENEFSDRDLFRPVEKMDAVLQKSTFGLATDERVQQNEILNFIEESILSKDVFDFKMQNTSMSFFPHRLIYLEGNLCVVGENLKDKSLQNIPVDQIENLCEKDKPWNPTHSKLEVDDFICSIRSMTESETRLVLKIHALASFENSIPRNHLGNPAMISNPDGDLIWGATVESNIEIFHWLFELGPDVEILDPTSFKKDYLTYCEDKLKKLA